MFVTNPIHAQVEVLWVVKDDEHCGTKTGRGDGGVCSLGWVIIIGSVDLNRWDWGLGVWWGWGSGVIIIIIIIIIAIDNVMA